MSPSESAPSGPPILETIDPSNIQQDDVFVCNKAFPAEVMSYGSIGGKFNGMQHSFKTNEVIHILSTPTSKESPTDELSRIHGEPIVYFTTNYSNGNTYYAKLRDFSAQMEGNVFVDQRQEGSSIAQNPDRASKIIRRIDRPRSTDSNHANFTGVDEKLWKFLTQCHEVSTAQPQLEEPEEIPFSIIESLTANSIKGREIFVAQEPFSLEYMEELDRDFEGQTLHIRPKEVIRISETSTAEQDPNGTRPTATHEIQQEVGTHVLRISTTMAPGRSFYVRLDDFLKVAPGKIALNRRGVRTFKDNLPRAERVLRGTEKKRADDKFMISEVLADAYNARHPQTDPQD